MKSDPSPSLVNLPLPALHFPPMAVKPLAAKGIGEIHQAAGTAGKAPTVHKKIIPFPTENRRLPHPHTDVGQYVCMRSLSIQQFQVNGGRLVPDPQGSSAVGEGFPIPITAPLVLWYAWIAAAPPDLAGAAEPQCLTVDIPCVLAVQQEIAIREAADPHHTKF